ncbi:MAG: N-acetylmuramoyl-L-alanine amidase [Chitinophagaceae bacterium]|nr:N-acetylmuramoyl-L-alanine amidase [Chitinophagaceae bacterium]
MNNIKIYIVMFKNIGMILVFIGFNYCLGQAPILPFIKLVEPTKESQVVKLSKQYIVGSTCKTCNLTINEKPVKVFATGAFAYEVNLKIGDSIFNIIASTPENKTTTKKIIYNYTPPLPPDTVKTLTITDIDVYPEGNLYVKPGDRIKFKVKTLKGCKVFANSNIPLYEIPTSATNKMPGIYQGEYVVKETDSFFVTKIPITVTEKGGKSVTEKTNTWISMFSPLAPNIGITKGRLAHLLFGLGDDRLGGAKMGYIDSAVLLNVIGKIGSNYKVQLSKYRTAYVPDDVIDFLPKGTFTPESLTTNWRVYGDSVYDYVTVGLFARLPYQSMQVINPSKIVVDVFGVTNNTNWITQLENTEEIKNVYYEQTQDEIFRITIELKHQQHWGHFIYYKGNNLVIKIRRQPKELTLSKLTIAVDAGHGGSNTGAGGPTGSSEKAIALQLAVKLQQALQKEGAKVIMSRSKETFFDNKERILFYRDSLPDLLLSVHLNSSSDPIRVSGTSVFYRYIGFKEFGNTIYKKLLELGLKEYGNNGSFNFMLNSPIEYPNALLETLFISNPEDEMKIMDENFQQQFVNKVVAGIKEFLEKCKD